MRNSGGRIQTLFALVLALAFGLDGLSGVHAIHAFAQDDPDCGTQGSGDGQGGGSGGAGGGMCGGGGAGGAPGGRRPGATGEPSGGGNGSSGGGDGGNGSNGDAGQNNVPTPTPPPSLGGDAGSGGRSTSQQPAATSGTTSPEAVANLAKNLSTKPDEVKSWFGAINSNDSVAGQARSIVVHPDDQVTIFAGDPVDATNDGGILRSGIATVGDASTKGGDTVEITMHSDPATLGSTVTEAGGRFSATVRIPPSTEVGRHFIVALVPNTHQGRAAFIYPVTVTARDEAAAPISENVTPTSGESKKFPWLLLEFLLGSALVIALFVVRVRRASAPEY